MNPKEIVALQRLQRRLERLAMEIIDCRVEMADFGYDWPAQPIDPANFPVEVEIMAAEINKKLERQYKVEQLDDLPF